MKKRRVASGGLSEVKQLRVTIAHPNGASLLPFVLDNVGFPVLVEKLRRLMWNVSTPHCWRNDSEGNVHVMDKATWDSILTSQMKAANNHIDLHATSYSASVGGENNWVSH